jgi:type-F conjugative transfer system pilin assembly protein TrbC
MEKKELLFILKIIAVSLLSIGASGVANAHEELKVIDELNSVKVDAEDLELADKLSNQAQNITLDYINELLGQHKIYGEDYSTLATEARRGNLRIFVSFAMPVSLLKAYARDAEKYGGVLVFNGLPQGSFKEFARLITLIQTSEDQASMQIDEEAYKNYEVNSVPAIVLSKEEDCLKVISCKRVFDKVSGNIGVKAALEKFAQNGDIQHRASELLK